MEKIKVSILGASMLILFSGLYISQGLVHAQAKDSAEPTDVENVVAVPGDSKITLSWDASTDNVGVTGYKIYYGTESVTKDGQQYNLGFVKTDNVTTSDVTGLTNGTTYYFAITALDAEGNESINYSVEVNGTPAAPATSQDTTAPRVSSAMGVSNTSVKIEFSEEIVLPQTAGETAFSIKEMETDTELSVITARSDQSDAKVVILTTEPQTKDKKYEITVGIGVEDKAGNPIVSGVSDTAVFTGKGSSTTEAPKDEQPPDTVEPTDTTSPKLSSAVATAANQIKITFSEEVVLGNNPKQQFTVNEKDSPDKKIAIQDAVLSATDKKIVTLTTETLTGGRTYMVKASGVSDLSGNEISGVSGDNQATFQAMTGSIADLIPPEDVTNFIASIKNSAIHLSWKASANSAGDLLEQILYLSKNKGQTYDKKQSLGPTVTNYDVTGLGGGQEYTFKLTVKDKAGNESKGSTTSISLPSTGPGIAVLFLAALGIGVIVNRIRS